MPVYNITHIDGSQQQFRALRLSRHHDRIHFEDRRAGTWVTSLTLPTDDVADVRQRVTELNGFRRWGTARVIDR
jgi:hypothetical protein